MLNFVALKMKKWSSQWTQFMQLRKVQDFNGVWTRDPAITWAMLYQLSYEAADVGSRSNVGRKGESKNSQNVTIQKSKRSTLW